MGGYGSGSFFIEIALAADCPSDCCWGGGGGGVDSVVLVTSGGVVVAGVGGGVLKGCGGRVLAAFSMAKASRCRISSLGSVLLVFLLFSFADLCGSCLVGPSS